jgi:tetratricopeptide (TPR) repeat protein
MEIWRKAIEQDVCPVSVYLAMDSLYKASNAVHKRSQLLLQCIEKYPAQAAPYMRLAAIHVHNREYEDALDILKDGLRHNPENGILKSNISWVMLQAGRNFQQALSLAQEAYRLAPEKAAVVDTLGWAYYKKKLYTRAIWHLQEAEKLAPGNPKIKEHLKTALQAQVKAKEKAGSESTHP